MLDLRIAGRDVGEAEVGIVDRESRRLVGGDVEVAATGHELEGRRLEQQLALDAVGLLLAAQDEALGQLGSGQREVDVLVRVHVGREQSDGRPEVLAQADAHAGGPGLLRLQRAEVVLVVVQAQVAGFQVPVTHLGLQARARAELRLDEGVGDLVVLRVVRAEAVRLEAAVAGAEGELPVDARDDALSGQRGVLAEQEAALGRESVAVEERVELVEGERGGPLRGRQEQVALPEAGLDRRRVEGLEHLRLEQLADSRDLVPRQRGVGVRQQAVGREVAGVGVHRGPTLDEGQVLEAEVRVQAAQARAARREVRVEQQPRAVDRPVVVALDGGLRVLQRLHRTVRGLLGDGVVEPRRRVLRIGLLGQLVLAADQVVALRLEVGLAQVAAQERLTRVEADRQLDLPTALRERPVADLREA